jgi:multidrug efflux pump subunit AcrB
VGGRSHVVFLLPIAPGLGRGPTAIAMIGGLLVATHLTLVLLPTINVVMLSVSMGKQAKAVASV